MYPSSHRNLFARAFEQTDNASVTYFRVIFGVLMAQWAWDYLAQGIVNRVYIQPKFHFSYYLLDWIKPLPGDGMVAIFLMLLLLAVCIAVGCLYRLSSLLFAILFTYVFLLERTNYQNHYYLIGLIAWWLPWMPLHRNVSVDAFWWPKFRSQTAPAWTLWMLRFHIALPYVFGGLAKLNGDWLLGQPFAQMLASQASLPFIGPTLTDANVAVVLAWCGLLFDLLVVPMLLWRPTRLFAVVCCVFFHLSNSVLFNIHVFPWFMLAATPLFFEPDWPRRILSSGVQSKTELPLGFVNSPGRLQKLLVVAMLAYVAFHCAWPLRHHLYPGNASWNERGHYFAWRMMLRGKSVVLGFVIKDKVTGQVLDGKINRFLGPDQSEKFGRDPEMILQFAHFLGAEYQATTGRPAAVHVLALASLNGRKPELMVDPNVDLTKEPRGWYARSWVMPQREPLRRQPWDLPIEQWRNHVELPELKFLANAIPPEPAKDSDSGSALASSQP